jgi:hypothetical protein
LSIVDLAERIPGMHVGERRVVANRLIDAASMTQNAAEQVRAPRAYVLLLRSNCATRHAG